MNGNTIEKLKRQLCRLLECRILPPGSYLAGGTAVYFYLRHRVSFDLDFFSPKNFIPEIFIHSAKKCFKRVDVELMEEKTVILYISKEKIKFSLFFFPYKLLHETQSYVLRNKIICPLASLKDIEAMKAVAISQRGSAKDFIDLYFLLKKTGHSYDDVSKFVIKKYDLKKNYEYQLKTSFVYFDDAEKEIDDIIMAKENGQNEKIKENGWKEIRNFFEVFIK